MSRSSCFSLELSGRILTTTLIASHPFLDMIKLIESFEVCLYAIESDGRQTTKNEFQSTKFKKMRNSLWKEIC